MKRLPYLIFTASILLSGSMAIAQKIDFNVSDGYLANGYDLVSYFTNQPKKGSDKFTYTYDGIKVKFQNQENLNAFKSNPNKYLPQYGGWCAYAMGSKNEKVSIDPETYEIRDGKLYLFYNRFFNNTLESWQKEGPEKLKIQADKNWEGLKFSR